MGHICTWCCWGLLSNSTSDSKTVSMFETHTLCSGATFNAVLGKYKGQLMIKTKTLITGI